MGLTLYSEDDYVADVGPNRTWSLTVQAVNGLGARKYPAVESFFRESKTTDPVGVRAELDMLLAKEVGLPKLVRSTLTTLNKNLKRVKEIAIIAE